MPAPSDNHNSLHVYDGNGNIEAGTEDPAQADACAEDVARRLGGVAVIYRAVKTVKIVHGKAVVETLP